jgi:hypothetical protein
MPFNQGHAILIGVGSHQHMPHLDVPISVADAQAVADVLRHQSYCGYPGEHVKVLSHAEASAANILAELEALAGRVKPAETVTFFYVGHGDYGTDGNYYLITHDAQASGDKVVPGTGLSQVALLDALRKLPAERVLLIFNACHAGELAPSSFGAGEAAGEEAAFGAQTLPNAAADALLSTGSGRIILGACREDQRSYIGGGKLSLFTQALVDALQGKDLLPRGGFINIFDLYTAVYESVKEKALMTLGREQQPELTVLKGVGPFAVALYRGASQTDLGLAETPAEPPQEAAVRQTSPEKSQRLYQQFVIQTGGVNFGQNNQISIGGSVIGTQETIQASGSQGFIYKPSGPVEQVFGDKVAGDKVGGDKITGDKIDTGGGAFIGGSVNTAGGDFAGRDLHKPVTQAPALDQFIATLQELRIAIQTAGLPDRERRSVEIDLELVEAEAKEAKPSQPVILSRLQSLRSLLEDAAGAGGAAVTLAELARRAAELAGQIFQ